jgi:oligoendopeptidase F
MGVSLVDMRMWQWLYAHPDATAQQLREATLAIAKEVWNTYYYPVLGEQDSPILACYSHMVNAPMYLPNYPFGHIVEFQLEEHLAQFSTKQAFADEIMRIYKLGKLTPNQWMQQAVGAKVSTTPILNAVEAILKK